MHDVTHTGLSSGESSFDTFPQQQQQQSYQQTESGCAVFARKMGKIEPSKVAETITITTKRNNHIEVITTNTDDFFSSLTCLCACYPLKSACVSAIAFLLLLFFFNFFLSFRSKMCVSYSQNTLSLALRAQIVHTKFIGLSGYLCVICSLRQLHVDLLLLLFRRVRDYCKYLHDHWVRTDGRFSLILYFYFILMWLHACTHTQTHIYSYLPS